MRMDIPAVLWYNHKTSDAVGSRAQIKKAAFEPAGWRKRAAGTIDKGEE
ncbi:MAG: hypothetical protein ACLU6W_01365 [Lachnospiraceae bacterium]